MKTRSSSRDVRRNCVVKIKRISMKIKKTNSKILKDDISVNMLTHNLNEKVDQNIQSLPISVQCSLNGNNTQNTQSLSNKNAMVNSSEYEFPSETFDLEPRKDIFKKCKDKRHHLNNSKKQDTPKCSNRYHEVKPSCLGQNLRENKEQLKQYVSPKMTLLLKENTLEFQKNRAKQLLHMVHKIISTPTDTFTSSKRSLNLDTSPIKTVYSLNVEDEGRKSVHSQFSILNIAKGSENVNAHVRCSLKKRISNVENLSPSDCRQIGKERGIKSARHPLRAVNILDVRELPSWRGENLVEILKNANKNRTTNQTSPSLCLRHNTKDNVLIQNPALCSIFTESNERRNINTTTNTLRTGCAQSNKCVESFNKTFLFGFEDYLESSAIENILENRETCKTSRKHEKTLPEKLKDLGKWRPKNIYTGTILKILPCVNKEFKNVSLFEKINTCNTKEIVSTNKIKPILSNKMYHNKFDKAKCIDSNDLFADSTELKKKVHIKTYTKSNEEKTNNIIYNHSTIKVKNKHNIEQKDDPQDKCKENIELEEFVKNFNEACSEVEQYQLIIDNDAANT